MIEQEIQILILTALLEKKEKPTHKIEPIYTDIGVDRETFSDVVEALERKKLISGAKVQRVGHGNQVQVIFLNTATIERVGEVFLKNQL